MSKPLKRYGIWQEKTKRYGLCWNYRVRVHESEGTVKMKTASGFASKNEAEAAVARLRLDSRARQHGIEVQKPLPATSIGNAVEAYIKALQARWRAKHGQVYVDRNSGQINALRNWAAFAGVDRPVVSINRDDFTFWQEQEAARGLQPSSIRRRINSIRAALNHGKDTRADLAAFHLPKRPINREADGHRMRILNDIEIRSLSDALSANIEWREAYDYFRVALGSGGRVDELVPTVMRADKSSAGVKWEDADGRHGMLRLFAHKTGKERVIHVPAVVAIIARRRRDGLGDETHAFTCKDHWLRKVFSAASIACEIPYGQQVRGGWTIHDLRHTCLTALLHAGTDLATVRDFAGHASISETTRYVHATDRSRSVAAQASSDLVTLATSG